ncbi:MAG: VOC family protein [Thermodesulfobacteriota bacterium]
MKIKVTSVLVDDQQKALEFYTGVLGFRKKTDVPAGGARWLTVVSPEAPGDVELLLEPLGYPFAQTYQKALFDAGIPLTMFHVDDLEAEYARLTGRGVAFSVPPTKTGTGLSYAIFDDTCGNRIMIAAQEEPS